MPRITFRAAAIVAFVAPLSAQTPGWQAPFAGEAITLGPDVIYGSGSDGALVAIDAETSEERWRFQIGTPEAASNVIERPVGFAAIEAAGARRIVLSPPLWHASLVYVGSPHSQPSDLPNFYAVDAESGRPRWSFFAPGGVFDVAADRDRVILVGERFVHALDAATGEVRWSFEPLEGLHEAARRPPSVPIIDNESLYLTGWPFHQFDAPHHSYLFALDAASGERRWTVDVAGNDVTTPMVLANTVYFAVHQPSVTIERDGALFSSGRDTSTVYAVDAANGAIRWQAAVENADGVLALTARDDALYVAIYNPFADSGTADQLVALAADTGALKWKLADWRLAEIMPLDSALYTVQGEMLAAVDPLTGRAGRSVRVRADWLHFSDGQLLFTSSGNRIAAHELTTGKRRWEKRLDSPVKLVLSRERYLFVWTAGEDIVGSEPRPGYIYRLDAAAGESR